MKIKIIVQITLCIFVFSSCATIRFGKSTTITIESENLSDTVNIIAIGPKGIERYDNVTFPYQIKVKHNNLPLRISLESLKNSYDPFTIGAIRKGEIIGPISKLLGYTELAVSLGVTAVLEFGGGGGFSDPGTLSAMIPSVGIGAALLAIGYTAKTKIPDNRFFLTSSSPITEETKFKTENWWRHLCNITDIYTLIENKEYELSEAKARWIIGQNPTGELFYLKGISNYFLNNHKAALEDLKVALTYQDAEKNSGLRKEIFQAIEDVENAKQLKSIKRNQLWSNIAGSTLQLASSSYQAYDQYKHQNWDKNGISSNGIVTDPSKLSQKQLDQLKNPMFAVQQVQQQYWQEYLEFSRYNKKNDGSNYTYEEWWIIKGQAIQNLKDEGYDIIAENQKQIDQEKSDRAAKRQKDKEDWFENYGYQANNETDITSKKDSSKETPISTSNKSSSSTNNSTISPNKTEDLDVKQQNHRSPVASKDYQKIKTVTLYYREGDKAKVKMNNVELYKKEAYYYIKIGNTFYPRRSPNWLRFRNAIAYGHEQLYYND